MLLLPDPRRGRTLPGSLPIIRDGEYQLTKVGFQTDVSFADVAEQVLFTPSYIEVRNREQIDQLGVAARWRRIEAVYARVPLEDTRIANWLAAHRDFMATGDPINGTLNTTVRSLRRALAEIEASYNKDFDLLPVLEARAGIVPAGGPELPPPDEIGEEDVEVRVRSAHNYRLSKARGTAARNFSTAVRSAYDHRCMFCGLVLGGFAGVPSGVEAAHILAWSNYDLDVVSNGIALCRLHHWAFDAGLMVPEFRGDKYYVRFTSLAFDVLDNDAIARLGDDGFEIPDDWLPTFASERPSQKYLAQLYDDLSIILR